MPGHSLISSCWTPPGESGPANSGKLIPSFGACLSLAARSRAVSRLAVVAFLTPIPWLDGCTEKAAVLESDQLAVVKRARAAERELDRADCRVRHGKRHRLWRLTDHESGVRGVGIAATEVDR